MGKEVGRAFSNGWGNKRQGRRRMEEKGERIEEKVKIELLQVGKGPEREEQTGKEGGVGTKT